MDCTKLPIWVRIHELPLEYMTVEGLSRVASLLGTPLWMDQATRLGAYMATTKLCIEMDADCPFSSELQIHPKGEERLTLFIHYFYIPDRCEQCVDFGHKVGEGVECGKMYSEQLVVVGVDFVISEGVGAKGKDKIVEPEPLIPTTSGASGSFGVVAVDPQVGLGSSKVGGQITVTAASSSTKSRDGLIDADGFQLVVRKGKNDSTGCEQGSNVHIPASAVLSRVPLNSKSIKLVVPASPKKGGKNKKRGK
ncbi:unnamed protein product [Linum trigynum]|uniref:DUF4283 domain-containing protein n=1 Tax=Linum trigynum TaxID=586398 RepID=A0AAV2EWS8_9ROSI